MSPNSPKILADYEFIDIHYYAAPDLYQRRYDVFQAGHIYNKYHGAMVLRSHLGSTSLQATLAQKQGLPVLPSQVLNHFSGGIDFRRILLALNEYQGTIITRLIVDLPTITGKTYSSRLPRKLVNPFLQKYSMHGESVFDEHAKLRKPVIDIIKLACDYPIILSTGHASKAEVYALIEACLHYNFSYLLINQPAHPLTNMDATELIDIAKNTPFWIEQTTLTYLLNYQTHEELAQVLQTVPRLIYSSDLGQNNQMNIDEWLLYSKTLFETCKLTELRQQQILREHPLQLLTL